MKNDITEIAAAYLAAKSAEDVAVAERRRIGKLLEDAMPGPDEGTTKLALENVTVAISRKVTRKVDSASLTENWGELSDNCQAAFRWSADLNTKHYRALQELGTAELAEVNRFVTSKPAAASIEVTIKEQ